MHTTGGYSAVVFFIVCYCLYYKLIKIGSTTSWMDKRMNGFSDIDQSLHSNDTNLLVRLSAGSSEKYWWCSIEYYYSTVYFKEQASLYAY